MAGRDSVCLFVFRLLSAGHLKGWSASCFSPAVVRLVVLVDEDEFWLVGLAKENNSTKKTLKSTHEIRRKH